MLIETSHERPLVAEGAARVNDTPTHSTSTVQQSAADGGRELATQLVAQPKDVNAAGDIFGGWLVSQMDLAGAVMAQRLAKGRVATVAIDDMVFKAPVAVGSLVSCYATLIRIGKTSLRIQIDVFATVRHHINPAPVASGHFTFVALDENGRPRPVRDDTQDSTHASSSLA